MSPTLREVFWMFVAFGVISLLLLGLSLWLGPNGRI